MAVWYWIFGVCFLISQLSAEVLKADHQVRRVILDVDAGTDDAFALVALLDAHKLGLLKIEAIVCTMGNTDLESVSKNVLRILESLEITNIPIFKGATSSLILTHEEPEFYFGVDGFGDLEYDTDPNLELISREPAIHAIYDIVTKNPKEITLVCLAPLTNIALALKVFKNLADSFQEIFIMGGNYLGIGNVKDMAEFNFYVDPESAFIVLNEAKCPITILPWETCVLSPLTLDWRFNVLGKHKSNFMDLMNRAEKKIFTGMKADDQWTGCDGYTALYLLHPHISTSEQRFNVTVDTCGQHTRGQVIVRRREEIENTNVNIIKKLDYSQVKRLFVDIVKRLVK